MGAAVRGNAAAVLWINLAIVYVVWGSTYFGIAVAIETIPPFLMAAIRFAIAGSLLIAWDLARHPEARRMPSVRNVVDSLIVGGLLLGVANGFVAYGERTVASGIAAILVAMMPLWFALLGWIYLRERVPRIVIFAIGIGFIGTALLVAPAGDGANSFDPVAILILFIAPIAWAHGSIYSARRAKLPASPLTASGMQMLAGALVTGVEALLLGEPATFHPEAVSMNSILAVVYLVLFGSMVAYTAYGWLLRNAPLPLVSTYAYINPVVAVALGTVFLGETLSVRTIVASAVIILAVAIIVTARSRLAGSETSAASTATPSVSPAAPPRAPSG